ncbi:MAG: hypothetical protein OMM_03161 [Candidatus Magnetoglobus multicellularis str. Araruama]|uniref:Cohesin domain-containing protein n=1 Tax=Candidatus Magnetoglobus multicellularis str. Araruama TaxID=890399 RepID=A0A1V1P6Z4_9BACT|nr:MAG: hypothetical protein OMM_03161 [Candidatus Magnetoglobus multicellularis str. Araruama]
MKILRSLISVRVYAVFIGVFIMSSTVWAELPLMMFSFEDQEFDIGNTFEVEVRLRKADKELGSFSFTLLFDKQVLKIIAIDGGMHGNLPDANTIGSVNIAQFSSQWPIIDSCWVLSKITFQVIGDYCSVSELTLSQVTLYDTHIKHMDSDTENSGISVICPRAKLNGAPQGTIHDNYAQMQVTGTGLTHYKYSLDSLPYSDEISIDTPISLYNLSEGAHCIHVLGKIASVWQTKQEATKACWYIFMPRPYVQKISPVYGSENGHTTVDIQGMHFHSDCRVFLVMLKLKRSALLTQTLCAFHPDTFPKLLMSYLKILMKKK